MREEAARHTPETVGQSAREGGKAWRSFFREQLLLWVQIALCMAAVAGFLLLKAVGGSAYAAAATWFFENYNDPVMTTLEEQPLFFRDDISITETSMLTYTPVGEASAFSDPPEKGETP